VQFTLIDDNKQPVARFQRDAQRGLNSFEWDLAIDRDLALASEHAALEKLKADERDQLKHRRYSESVRLGHRLYPLPGKYTVRIEQGSASHETALEIKAPKAYEPRHTPPYNLRGDDDSASARTQPMPRPHPRANSRARPWTNPGK
jgi:hypothetical protein